MSQSYKAPGEVLTLTAPEDLTSGEGFLSDGFFAVATADADSGDEVEGHTEGVHELTKTSAQAWTEGQRIFWDAANDRADSNAALGPFIGFATEAAANPSTAGKVKLCPSKSRAYAVASEGSPAPTSVATAGAGTITAAMILTGIYVRDCAGAARTDTLSTAALLVAAVPGAKVGDILKLYVVNGSDADETLTLAAGTGGDFDANQTAASRVVAQNSSKLLHIRLTNVTAEAEAYVVYA